MFLINLVCELSECVTGSSVLPRILIRFQVVQSISAWRVQSCQINYLIPDYRTGFSRGYRSPRGVDVFRRALTAIGRSWRSERDTRLVHLDSRDTQTSRVRDSKQNRENQEKENYRDREKDQIILSLSLKGPETLPAESPRVWFAKGKVEDPSREYRIVLNSRVNRFSCFLMPNAYPPFNPLLVPHFAILLSLSLSFFIFFFFNPSTSSSSDSTHSNK